MNKVIVIINNFQKNLSILFLNGCNQQYLKF